MGKKFVASISHFYFKTTWVQDNILYQNGHSTSQKHLIQLNLVKVVTEYIIFQWNNFYLQVLKFLRMVFIM